MKFHEITFYVKFQGLVAHSVPPTHYPAVTAHRRDVNRGHRQQHAAPREGKVPQLLPASSDPPGLALTERSKNLRPGMPLPVTQ